MSSFDSMAQCSITHILCEINFWDSRSAQPAILPNLEALNFDFNDFIQLLRTEMYKKSNFSASETAKMADFHLFRIPKIDFT